MANGTSSQTGPLFVAVGENDARMFGLDARTRAERLASNAKLQVGREPEPSRSVLLANLSYAFDPAWLGVMKARPGAVLALGGVPVLAHLDADTDPASTQATMRDTAPLVDSGLQLLDAETADISYHELRKRDRPFALRLTAESADAAERAAYNAAYKGVTDLLTLYLWRRPAFYLTRWAASAGLTPNMVTLVGFAFCVLAFWLFWNGHYWAGFASGFVFMVLDTVDGKLARCTGTSSKWGNIFDHGTDLIHPPFWWWAWLHGLGAVGLALEPVYAAMVLGAIVAGYVVQRLIEGIFMRRFGMHIHVWQPIDSRFRLITARRNPNMVILFVALLLGRPDLGIELVALWTLVSLIFHAVRLAQANARRERGEPVKSWLA
ncbi:CDP-alcohol phosphatidyltransferase family protein [Sphingomonas arenae]|uniref:CDP-alcohol phosphatidyltransferase family protein n=1 Tax=Sphingomonas arenae TaxID=2812555 RepID=UPI0019673AC8|nr:CDP-alcohol phosphatidyltransferase family protein [Sphingomonas arenae]